MASCELAADKTTRSTYRGENLYELVDKLVDLQKKIKTMTLIVHRDESDDPDKSKLWIDDIKRNPEFLMILKDAQSNLSFGKKMVKQILSEVAKKSTIKFKSSDEKDDWILR